MNETASAVTTSDTEGDTEGVDAPAIVRTGNPTVTDVAEISPDVDLGDPDLYINRELSWLEFNERVLDEAYDARNPLLERLRFLSICANNLDEFFMVRVSGLRQQVAAGVKSQTPDGMTPREQLEAIDLRCRKMLVDMNTCFSESLEPLLDAEGLGFRGWSDLKDDERAYMSEYFREHIFPVLTPLAVDPAHPFPYISNLSLSLAVMVRDPESGEELFARVKVPSLLTRFVGLPGTDEVVPLEQLVAAHLEMLFPGMEILEHHAFRVIRDADFAIEEDEADDLLEEIEAGVRSRRFSSVVSLSISPGMPRRIRELLARELEVDAGDIYEVPGLLGMADLDDILDIDRPDLFYAPWVPQNVAALTDGEGNPANFFGVLRKRDVLVHHPYDSFSTTVEEFMHQAVHDPQVLAIKTTLYRTSSDSRILRRLIEAAEAGKQVVVVVEIKARFDEERNIRWARRLEAAGAHVVYGIVGLKTHAKTILVVRQEDDGIRRYVHIGTGNYNASTARLYEDLGLFSSRSVLGADLSDLFNFLTGYSRQRKFRRILASPFSLRDGLVSRIDREIEHAQAGRTAHIRLKDNSLLDSRIVQKLYEASRAGVDVDILVRGICSLRPGIPNVSDRIRVRSVIGRFLEHSRIYHFANDGNDEYLIGSADIMPRNLDRRVEALTPVLDPELQLRLDWILTTNLEDTRQGWQLENNGSWTRLADGDESTGTHSTFMRTALEEARSE